MCSAILEWFDIFPPLMLCPGHRYIYHIVLACNSSRNITLNRLIMDKYIMEKYFKATPLHKEANKGKILHLKPRHKKLRIYVHLTPINNTLNKSLG